MSLNQVQNQTTESCQTSSKSQRERLLCSVSVVSPYDIDLRLNIFPRPALRHSLSVRTQKRVSGSQARNTKVVEFSFKIN